MGYARRLLHANDPYLGWPLGALDTDLRGWGGHPEFFKKMIERVSPHLIVEVGTWKGKSACSMARALDQIVRDEDDSLLSQYGYTGAGLPTPKEWARFTEIVCVDTWLGATEFWLDHNDEKRYGSLQLNNGYPNVYYQFISNVVNEGLQERITPFPQTSTNAARFFKEKQLCADLIYIDASHAYEDVKADLEVWGERLSSWGVMFGDDYCQHWSGVIRAVDEYAKKNGLNLQTFRYENPDKQAPSDYWVLSRKAIDIR